MMELKAVAAQAGPSTLVAYESRWWACPRLGHSLVASASAAIVPGGALLVCLLSRQLSQQLHTNFHKTTTNFLLSNRK